MYQVTIIDYGIGNLLSVTRAFEYWGAKVILADDAAKIVNADRLVLPGVGAFADGMAGLEAKNLIEPIHAFVKTGKPFLGICLGMQMMLEQSEEFGSNKGLGLIKGIVRAIPKTDNNDVPHKVPHIGWNYLCESQTGRWEKTILKECTKEDAVYFVHSFTAEPRDINNRLADSFYNGRQISAAIQKDNMYGCQFHPEKSGLVGLKIINGFLAIN